MQEQLNGSLQVRLPAVAPRLNKLNIDEKQYCGEEDHPLTRLKVLDGRV